VSFSAVVNQYGFLKYSKIEQGNVNDSQTLLETIRQMEHRSKSGRLDKAVVIDAGMVSEANLTQLREKGVKYVCVSRTKPEDYEGYLSPQMKQITDNRGNKIEIKLIEPQGKPDQWLLVKSEMKAQKEMSIRSKLEERFEKELSAVKEGIHKKGGVKKIERVWERIGRAKERYKRVQNKYTIYVKEKNGIALELDWERKAEVEMNKGVYFIRTNIEGKSEKEIWDIYNTIREVESTFRCLKTDLSIRPIFHQKDVYSAAHINLGLMAYQLVAAIRHRLKSNGINSDWTNIVRVMNSQKMNTIKLKLKTKEVHLRKASSPERTVKRIYDIMGIKEFPKPTKKYVVYH
jgi:hypothetical protein